MDTCRSRTVDHGPLLAYGLFRLPAPAARTAPSADTGCAHTCVSRRHTVVVVVVVIDSIGTPTASTHGQRDFLVFLALKKFFPRRPYSWSPHHHTSSPALLVPRQSIRTSILAVLIPLLPCVFHLFSSHRKSHHVHQRTQIPHLHFYVINTRRTPRTVGRVERSFLERLLYCTVCDDAALSIHSLFDQCLQCNVCLILTLAVKKRVSCFFEAWFLAYWYYTPRTGYTSRSPGTVRSTSYAPHLIHVLYVKPSHARRAIPPGRRCAIVIVIVFPLWESTPVCYDEG